MKSLKTVFIVLFFILCLIPLVSMPVWGNEAAESSSSVKRFPQLVSEDGLNRDFLGEAGDYFSYNFGLRQEFVAMQGAVQTGLLKSSTQDAVIAGSEGWLYYESTLDDYLGREKLSELQLYNISYNLTTIRSVLAKNDIDFVFTVAPNKNSLYPEHMPEGYVRSKGTKNYDRLLPYLENSDVSYVNLFDLFESDDRVLYHSGDSHWNNTGASMVADAIFNSLGREHRDYTELTPEIRCDHEGDLEAMIYPVATPVEEDQYFDFDYTYVHDIKSTYDPEIETENQDMTGRVVMFRDSFGNSLLPFIAQEYKEGFFSRGVPYEAYRALDETDEPVTVIAEVVERNLRYLAQSAPILADTEGEDIYPSDEPTEGYTGSLEYTDSFQGRDSDHPYIKITGRADPDYMTIGTKSYIYMRNETKGFGYAFPAYHTCEGDAYEPGAAYGLCCYVLPDQLPDGEYSVSIVHDNDGELVRSESYFSYTIRS